MRCTGQQPDDVQPRAWDRKDIYSNRGGGPFKPIQGFPLETRLVNQKPVCVNSLLISRRKDNGRRVVNNMIIDFGLVAERQRVLKKKFKDAERRGLR
jgi:hypothetical protein